MTVVEDRRLRWLLWASVALIGAGVYAFVLRGADGPADPELAERVVAARPGDPERVPFGGFGEVAISVDPGDGRGLLAWCLLAAQNQAQRSRGLMEVDDLQGYSGMAFVYDPPVENSFYMRNTPTPLSIAWIDEAGHLVSTADMEPCPDRDGCPTYPPAGPYSVAIEVFQGDLDELGIIPGSTTEITGSCADNLPD
jgi:uncharacterized membrane protein (UPF0127 family)